VARQRNHAENIVSARPITFAQAQLPLSLQSWENGDISLIDARGFFVVTVTLEQLRAVIETIAKATERAPWPGQPIPRGPA